MEAETIIANSSALSSNLNKYKKTSKKSYAGNIPTLVESVVFEHPADEKESVDDEIEEIFEELESPEPVNNGNNNNGNSSAKGRRSSFGGIPKAARRGSLGLSQLLGFKSKPDATAGNYTTKSSTNLEDDFEEIMTPPTKLPPRRSSIAVGIEDKGRRKSLVARLQLDRRRNKSGGDDDEEPEPGSLGRTKRRPSWWSGLVPENLLKSRSKSRSVDHGLAAPFDLDSLRSKVEGRFDSVQREEDDFVITKRIPPAPPIKTTTYVVRDRDTLTSVAARFDTTPSELTKLNRLATPFVFPGQNLLVPDKEDDGKDLSSEGAEGGSDTSSQQAGPTQEKDMLDNLRPVSPEPLTSPANPQRFLKINVRHITDGQGVVSGVLLVTPNAVMFDPNVSDTLVMEHGPESYGVIAPMEFVVNAAIYYDIAHMRTQDSNPNITRGEKPEIYYMNKANSPDKDSLVKDETFPELATTGAEDSEWSTEGGVGERGGDAFPKAFDRELVTPTTQQQACEERRRSLLDHHWAVPSKQRASVDLGTEVDRDKSPDRVLNLDPPPPGLMMVTPAVAEQAQQQQGPADPHQLHLVKLSCHDSGIDIREPLPTVVPNNTKKVYSDADIVLSQDWVPPVALSQAEPPLSAPPAPSEERVRKQTAVSFSVDTKQPPGNPQDKGDKKNKMLKRLSYPLSWMEGLAGEGGSGSSGGSQAESLPTSADSHNSASVFSKVFSRRSSMGGFGRPDAGKKLSTAAPPPRLDYRSMVSVDDMPELFVPFDQLILRPARSCDDPPLYLRLRMGRPANRPVPRSTPLMSYGRKRMRPEYWFSVPRNRVDDLYKFINHWVPELYGELGDVTERGYVLVDSDTELWDDEAGTPGEKGESQENPGDMGDLTRESWEVLSMSDELRRALYSSGASVDLEFCPPDLIGTTEVLTMEHREKLCGHLPARAQGYMWSLVFSSSVHGFSLNSMYRKMQRVDSPVLLVVQDTDNNVFGALTSCALHPSEHFYGTGESLLFSFCAARPMSPAHRGPPAPAAPQPPAEEEQEQPPPPPPERGFRVWQWTGDNQYFIRGSNDNISIGAGDGKFGLWLDGDLYQGRTQSCTTYGNESLSTQEDFIVKILECWAFI